MYFLSEIPQHAVKLPISWAFSGTARTARSDCSKSLS